MATITKTQGTIILSHQLVTHPGTAVGTAQDVSTKLSARIYLFHGFVEAVANTNPGTFFVQTSASATGDENWVTEAQLTTNTGTPAIETMTATEPIGEIVMAVASTTGFAARDLLYIRDTGTLANSEWAFCRRIVTNTSIDLISGLTRAKDNADIIYNLSARFVVNLDLGSVGRLRVFFQHQGAAGADGHVKALMVTGDSIG